MRMMKHLMSRRTLMLLGLGALAVGAILLAGCGGSETITGNNPISASNVFLYSNVDYPLNIPVGSSDTVTLNLSLDDDILYVTPTAGHGQTPVGQPIPLPADVQNYKEIDVQASAQSAAPGPLVWQLTSPIQQTLLKQPVPSIDRADLKARYASSLQFQWRVQAVSAGQNTAKIALQITYVYTDGRQLPGTAELTQTPIPIVAVQPPPASNSWLPNFKLPVTLAAGFAGFFGFVQFLWNLYQAGRDAREAYQLARHAMGKTTKKKQQV